MYVQVSLASQTAVAESTAAVAEAFGELLDYPEVCDEHGIAASILARANDGDSTALAQIIAALVDALESEREWQAAAFAWQAEFGS